ncbi:MAG: segregation/condensation protein A [Planctomycetota bacterium]
MTGEATIRLEQFEGPLDLLLHLIRKHELEISEISVAAITDQHLSFLDDVTNGERPIDVDTAAEFLVTAATLVELKSRWVDAQQDGEATPGEQRERDDEGDAAAELIKSLLAYKAYREAADQLDERRAAWEKRYPLGRAAIDKSALAEAVRGQDEEVELEDVELYDLVEAFRTIYETVRFDRLGDHEVLDDDTPLELHAADLEDQIEREGSKTLGAIFEGRSRGEMIGLFLALLELVRQRKVHVRTQEGHLTRPRDITIERRQDAAEENDELDQDD